MGAGVRIACGGAQIPTRRSFENITKKLIEEERKKDEGFRGPPLLGSGLLLASNQYCRRHTEVRAHVVTVDTKGNEDIHSKSSRPARQALVNKPSTRNV